MKPPLELVHPLRLAIRWRVCLGCTHMLDSGIQPIDRSELPETFGQHIRAKSEPGLDWVSLSLECDLYDTPSDLCSGLRPGQAVRIDNHGQMTKITIIWSWCCGIIWACVCMLKDRHLFDFNQNDLSMSGWLPVHTQG